MIGPCVFFTFLAIAFVQFPSTKCGTAKELADKVKDDVNKLITTYTGGCNLPSANKPLITQGNSPNGDKPTETMVGMIKNAGYPVEVHKVTTKDGYILSMFRIPSGKSKASKAKNKPPVLLVHGLFSSPADWVTQDKDKALAYKLSEAGKDVWLGANRGTPDSQGHTSLKTSNPKYWQFSHVEYGLYDDIAFMDKIKEVTKQDQTFYIGHSLGTKQYFTLMSLFPGNCSRVKAMWALAPVAYMQHIKNPIARALSLVTGPATFGAKLLGNREFLNNNSALSTAAAAFCSANAGCAVCQNIVFMVGGFDPKQVNVPWQPTNLGHAPAPTSALNVIHEMQEIFYNRFGFVDFGPTINTKKYGKQFALKPPQFKTSNIANNKDCKIHIMYADNDWLTAPKDVKRLKKELGSAVKSFTKINFKEFNHIDFVWGKDANTLVYDQILREMKMYT